MDRTPCPSGKIPHGSIESAESQIRQVEARDRRRGRTDGRGPLHAYRCITCSTDEQVIFHVGHRRRKRKDPTS